MPSPRCYGPGRYYEIEAHAQEIRKLRAALIRGATLLEKTRETRASVADFLRHAAGEEQ